MIHDTELTGLGAEKSRTGAVTYFFRTRIAGQQRQIALGHGPELSVEQARTQCRRLLARVQAGEDIGLERARQRTPAFADFVQQQYLPFAKTNKRSWQTDETLLRVHLVPAFGDQLLHQITREAIAELIAQRLDAGAAPGSANRLIILMRYLFNLAARWKVPGVTENPARLVPLLIENNQRERFLSAEEVRRLFAALAESESLMLGFIVRMLVFTGARKNEVLQARWEEFDLARRVWRIPLPKSGKARHVPLSDAALQVLSEVPRYAHVPWVFANPKTERPYVHIYSAWNTARRRAGLEDVRIHDLRHSFASFLINSGRSIYEVQKLLGHTQIKTTQRYSHLSQETLLDAVNSTAAAISGPSLSVTRINAPEALFIHWRVGASARHAWGLACFSLACTDHCPHAMGGECHRLSHDGNADAHRPRGGLGEGKRGWRLFQAIHDTDGVSTIINALKRPLPLKTVVTR
ncbi:tyrosine-type recombinase/integrase [Thiorhodovibrio litoralis]|uniref:tyrosine-type recombinase/integrase n=1 Tax=Thiorhodovibrio litoralis TaxID=2952932 RepID=UPI001913AB92|nr:tyrosine-type recombinase/integrase [Thiorhodovibrio litoralis]